MKKIVLTLCIAALICGCKGKKEKNEQEDTNLARQEYAVEKNQVSVMTLTLKDFNKQLISNGRLEARSRSELAFASSGMVESIGYLDGEHVPAGAVIAVLDSKDARASLESAQLAYRKAEITLSDQLLDYDYTIADTATMPRDIREVVYINSGFADAAMSLANARRALDNRTLRAPFGGKIADVKANVYENASGTFCTLIDDEVMDVKFSVLETEYSFVRVGLPMQVVPFNDQLTKINGTITSINPSVDKNGQIAVTARVKNNGRLIDGMNVKVIVENKVPNQMVVPKNSVVIRDNLEILFRYVDGKSLWTYVNVLMSNSTEHVVEANTERGADLKVGDVIIVSGNQNLGGDTPVEIIE